MTISESDSERLMCTFLHELIKLLEDGTISIAGRGAESPKGMCQLIQAIFMIFKGLEGLTGWPVLGGTVQR